MSIFKNISEFKKEVVGNAVLFNGDALSVLNQIEDNSVDFICTDAPYIISKKTNFHIGGAFNNADDGRNRKTPVNYDFGEWDKKDLDLESLIKEFYRVLKPSGTLLFFYDVFKMQELKEVCEKHRFKQPRLCVWQKTNPVPVNSKLNYLSNAREFFMTFVKGSKPTFNSEYDNGFYEMPICAGKERLSHPTQKPMKLIKDLICKHSNENDIVLDCFAGSMTTADACQELNRKSVMVELDEKFFEIGVKRLKTE
jgi:site-specific DNA-methyltransferase (adenine-specific)